MGEEPRLQIQHGFNLQPDSDSGPIEPSQLSLVPGGQEPTLATPELRPVVDFLRALARAVKAVRLYPANNPIYLRFVDEMLEQMEAGFAGHETLPLVVIFEDRHTQLRVLGHAHAQL